MLIEELSEWLRSGDQVRRTRLDYDQQDTAGDKLESEKEKNEIN